MIVNMKQIIKCTLLAFILLWLSACGVQKGQQSNAKGNGQYATYAIAFYNVENLWHPSVDPQNARDRDFIPDGPYQWTTSKYQRKLDNLARVLSQLGREQTPLGPAFIGIAEVENRQVLEDLAARPAVRDMGLKVIHQEGPDHRGIDVAALYNPALFQLQSYKCYAYPKLENNPTFATRDQLRVTGLLAGERVHFIVMHWPSRYGGKTSDYLRVHAARLTLQIMDEIYAEEPDAKIIIMGDMNDDPDNASIEEVLQAKEYKDEVTPHGLYNPARSIHRQGIGTLAYQGKWNFFDQMIVNGNLLRPARKDQGGELQYWKMEIFNRSYLIQQEGRYKGAPFRSFQGNTFIDGYSDHFPVLIYLLKPLQR